MKIVLDYNICTAGVDEAGRGSLAGPVYAAAVILDHENPIYGLADSKTLSKKKRESLALIIKEKSLSWSVASASIEEIDNLNILQATLLAMQRAVTGLRIQPEMALIDGNISPLLRCKTQTIIKGDKFVPSISAASILAKTERDKKMVQLSTEYPQYLFDKNNGYCTSEHLKLIELNGPCLAHRRSFAPIKYIL
ncbi:ribonuclease HII [Candidatus Kinetoplastibacterium desouzaii TCC079E]|uniref:Ribonuclease HII n=1 Tax=Candidatus Kinetoplastidibacterium desouzai TCC079E TaxID=1208919 RepID=M1LRW5_9PROT|nr:ribonuclease HII [Candidatus Kinetoplastibacterium desouzaii]AGF46886.1 ribonuclease HII [Candidatus Kinetoplastibacterium desouzaii TCC079E]